MNREDRVRLIAYHIWEEEGHPQGHDLDHWLRAEAIWQEEEDFEEHMARDVEGCVLCT